MDAAPTAEAADSPIPEFGTVRQLARAGTGLTERRLRRLVREHPEAVADRDTGRPLIHWPTARRLLLEEEAQSPPSPPDTAAAWAKRKAS